MGAVQPRVSPLPSSLNATARAGPWARFRPGPPKPRQPHASPCLGSVARLAPRHSPVRLLYPQRTGHLRETARPVACTLAPATTWGFLSNRPTVEASAIWTPTSSTPRYPLSCSCTATQCPHRALSWYCSVRLVDCWWRGIDHLADRRGEEDGPPPGWEPTLAFLVWGAR